MCNLFYTFAVESLSCWSKLLPWQVSMKKLKERLQRKIKFYRVGFEQSSGDDRLSFVIFWGVMSVFLWWIIIGEWVAPAFAGYIH